MHRHFAATFLALTAAGLFLVAPAAAGDKEALRKEVQDLQEKVEALQAQQSVILNQEVEKYLEQRPVWGSAQGEGALSGISIHARLTVVNQNTIGLTPANRSVINGVVDLDFDFEVTDNLDLFLYLTANEGTASFDAEDPFDSDIENGGFPAQFGPVTTPGGSFPSIGGPTLAAFGDGIGVNGTIPTDPGSITVYEAGATLRTPVGDNTLNSQWGALDPRTRFLQNAFADDENTQFIHNMFDDSSAALWLTTAAGNTVFGFYQWVSFGDNKQYTVSWGWFNSPGQFFNNGQFYFQFHWKGEIQGREMNLYLMGFLDEFFVDATGDGSAGGGASWDWWVTEQIGIFVRIVVNGDDVNPVESDYSVGAQFNGLIGSRPDDVIGVAVGFTNANDTVLVGIPEDTELTVELYYKYVTEDGKLQVTPHLIYISDPGGGRGETFDDDALFILGIRVFVPF